MTNADLIAQLQKYPPDAQVLLVELSPTGRNFNRVSAARSLMVGMLPDGTITHFTSSMLEHRNHMPAVVIT